ncbi:MAG: glycosyltransferase [Ruminococcaceae bacterium]|nr:glycosyltransferase [Oscillospiraceae bacterium]
MKVLQINSVCGIRSTGRICTDIADSLSSLGHECKIAYGRETVPDKYRSIAHRISSGTDVRLHALCSRIFDNSGFASRKATEKFIKWVKDYDPDIIHLHNLHGYYINIEVLFEYLSSANKPVIWTFHDCWAFTGHCAHFDLIGCSKWKDGCECCVQKKSYPTSLIFDRSLQNYKLKKTLFNSVNNLTIVSPSDWLAGLVKDSFLKDKPVAVINNGIDTDIFKPTESDFRKKHDLSDKKIVLGVASAWGRTKGLYDFIKLSEMLDDSFKIVLVGLTEKQKESLPPKILGITRTNNTTELAKIYTAADIFVNPTYQDTFPTVNLEAISCRTQVIGYDTGGSGDFIKALKMKTVKRGDISALCDAIKSATTKDSSVNYKNIAIQYDKNLMYTKYIELYESCLK